MVLSDRWQNFRTESESVEGGRVFVYIVFTSLDHPDLPPSRHEQSLVLADPITIYARGL